MTALLMTGYSIIFLLGGVLVLFGILKVFVKNWESPFAIPVFALSIVVYMLVALLLGYYMPRWIP